MRRRIANKERTSAEEGKGVCTEEQEVEGGDNPVAPQCASSQTQRKIEDHRAGNKKLLVARGNGRYRAICRRM